MKNISIGPYVTVGDITIVPLETVKIQQKQKKDTLAFYVIKEPVAIIVSSQQGQEAIDINGKHVPLETYTSQVPDLQEILDSLSK